MRHLVRSAEFEKAEPDLANGKPNELNKTQVVGF